MHSWALCEINRSITDLKMVFRGRILTCRAVLLSLPSVPQSMLTTYCLHKTFYIKCWTLKSTYLPYAICSMQMPSYFRCCCFFSKWHFQGIPTRARRDQFSRTWELPFMRWESSNGLHSGTALCSSGKGCVTQENLLVERIFKIHTAVF